MNVLPLPDALSRPSGAGGTAEVLSPWDDYPIHQGPALLSSVTPAQPGWAERFYFNVLRPTGQIVAIVGGGCYPARGVAECYFCRIDGQRQLNIRGWQELPAPGAPVEAGAFSLRCDAPLRDWSVTVDVDGERFDGRFAGMAEPYLYSTSDVPASEPGGDFDLFRHFVALGRWQLTDAAGLDTSTELVGVRDRTWGVRTRRVRMHTWIVFRLGDACLTLIHQEFADGSVMFSEAGIVHGDGRMQRLDVSEHDFVYDPKDRQIHHGRVELSGEDGPLTLEFERVGLAMRLAGAGYDDSQGDRGLSSGTQRDEFDLGDPEVAARTGRGTMDAGAVGRVSGALNAEGHGVVETAIARNHVRYGSQVA